MRNRVERFFRYLKERTVVFHHKLSAIPKPIHNILSGHKGREVNKNAYLDTMASSDQKLLTSHHLASNFINQNILS
jgi:hypothetical protein